MIEFLKSNENRKITEFVDWSTNLLRENANNNENINYIISEIFSMIKNINFSSDTPEQILNIAIHDLSWRFKGFKTSKEVIDYLNKLNIAQGINSDQRNEIKLNKSSFSNKLEDLYCYPISLAITDRGGLDISEGCVFLLSELKERLASYGINLEKIDYKNSCGITILLHVPATVLDEIAKRNP